MPKNTCFVIMPIGDQSYGKIDISAHDLKKRYDDLIREALLAARPDLDITRADEVAIPGTITSDILTRLMHSDFVVADVSYPNPNVFYELGLRHACRPGTIIIRDAKAPKPPFDIAHLRHIEYQNTPTGLKELTEAFRRYFEHSALHPERPDNHFLELAKLTQYQFPDYGSTEKPVAPEIAAILALMASPELMNLLMRAGQGERIDPAQMFRAFAAEPDVAKQFLEALMRSGHFQFPPPTKQIQTPHRQKRRKN